MTFAHQAPLTHESIRALALRDDGEALTLLSVASSASDQFIRRSAIEAIGRLPRGQELRTSILDALTDSSDYVVRAACEVVARWTWSEAHDVVVSALASLSPPTREAAIRTLGAIWRENDFRPVFHIYIGDPERTVRREAAWVLRERVTAPDWLRLFEAFRTDDTPRHRVWACELAARFGGPSLSPLLATLVSDCDGHVRKAAGRAIETLARRRLEDPPWTHTMQHLIPQGKADLDRARAAVETGYPAVAPILAELTTWLQNCNWPVAHILIPFLASIGAPMAPTSLTS